MQLPLLWITAGSNPALWGEAQSYKPVPYEALPPIAGPLDGSFAWLAAAPVAISEGMGLMVREHAALGRELTARGAEARDLGLTLPPEFIRFMTDARLPRRLRTCTGCYFELGADLVPAPGGAYLLRFMNDAQSCFLWYLLLEPDGGHQVAVGMPTWDREGRVRLDAPPAELARCGPSFEEFIRRYWIETSLWFAAQHGAAAVGAELRAYAEAARRAADVAP